MADPEGSPFGVAGNPEEALLQCEVLSDVVEFAADADGPGAGVDVHRIVHPYAILLTQDCDLDRDWEVRRSGAETHHRLLRNLLLCEVTTAEELRTGEKGGNADMPPVNSSLWNSIRQNKDERFHFLEAAPPNLDAARRGVEELVVHFLRVFTVPTGRLYRAIDAAHTARRARLRSPYLEHLAHRFTTYWARIALPRPHTSD